jgi:hypothetical protein
MPIEPGCFAQSPTPGLGSSENGVERMDAFRVFLAGADVVEATPGRGAPGDVPQ